jgi:tripartite-type tricarboxylate transporter receptor subunit TctC
MKSMRQIEGPVQFGSRREMTRIPSLIFSIACVLLSLSGDARAQKFPAKPVTLIVPWPPGGPTDRQMRALARATEKHLGQAIVIENRPGASGTLGPMHMAQREKGDGYVLSQIPISLFRIPAGRGDAFDPATDLTFILQISAYTFGIVVRSDARWKTFGELVSYAKANPGVVTYATSGAQSVPHLTMETIGKRLGIVWTHVPYKGGAECVAALTGGHVDVVGDGSAWASQVNAGTFRLLVTWGEHRSRSWPDVPTLKESGIDMVVNSPYGIAGPKGIDLTIVRKLHDAFKRGLEDASHLAVLSSLDQEPAYLDSDRYRSFALEQIEEQRRISQQLQSRKK